MAERYSLRRLDAIEAKEQRLTFLEQEYPHLAQLARRDLLFSCMYHGQLALRDLDRADQTAALSGLNAAVKGCAGDLGDMKGTHKLWCLLAKRDVRLCCQIRNKLGIGL